MTSGARRPAKPVGDYRKLVWRAIAESPKPVAWLAQQARLGSHTRENLSSRARVHSARMANARFMNNSSSFRAKPDRSTVTGLAVAGLLVLAITGAAVAHAVATHSIGTDVRTASRRRRLHSRRAGDPPAGQPATRTTTSPRVRAGHLAVGSSDRRRGHRRGGRADGILFVCRDHRRRRMRLRPTVMRHDSPISLGGDAGY